ncbi:unnamed protein product, partial [Discosporangium mesarthrocarpum]
MADPRAIISRGMGLSVVPVTKKEGLLKGITRRILSGGEVEETLHILRVAAGTNETDCLLAPLFPGDIVLVPIGRPHRKRKARSTAETITRPRESDEGPALLLSRQSVMAASPGVDVKPSSSHKGGTGSGHRYAPLARGNSHHVLTGQGTVAVSAFGRLKRFKLGRGEHRALSSSRVVGWTANVRQRSGGIAPPGSMVGPMTVFEGPGEVYIQTHSIPDFRRLVSVRPTVGPACAVDGDARSPSGIFAGARGVTRRGSGGGGSGISSVGLSLKRGFLKRLRVGASRVAMAIAFGVLYLALYSILTALLLEGKAGLRKVPQHMLRVVRSLGAVAQRIAAVLVRVAQEELSRDAQAG